jgi:cupin 2 domain-containing protein
MTNFFEGIEPPAKGERFDLLLAHKNLVIERIVSSSDIAPSQYVQAQDEWVLLMQGGAVLEVAGEQHRLSAGDHVFIPAGVAHTVLQTEPGTLWLAVHLHPDSRSA